jgi:molecular chaperone DnaK (HSP70)
MIGLDFGTTNSCAAFSDVYGITAASVEPDQEVPYHTVLRTAVLDPEGEAPMLGAAAIRASEMPREKRPCLISFKPMLDEMQLKTLVREEVRAGRYFHQMSQAELDRYEYRDVWKGGRYSRAELLKSTGLILQRLLATAIAEGGEGDLLWLGLPVTFSGIARKRLVAALADARDSHGRRIFGGYGDVLRRTRFVLEPVAVASLPMQEAIDVADRETVLVFDHGGGTLDLSLIEFARLPQFEYPMPVRELAARGSDTVGGRSIDMAFRSALADSSAFRDALSTFRDYTVDALVEAAKIRLSTSDSAEVFGGARVGRDDFESAIAPLLDDIDTLVRATVASAGLDVGDVDRVVMTGGSSLIPAVQAHLGSLFPHLDEYHLLTYDPSSKDDVERAVTEVARGLVAFGTQVAESGVFEQVVLWDMSMSLAPQRGMSVLIPRGTPYHRNGDRALKLTVNAPLPARPGEGSSVGLYEDQLDQRFVFGLCDLPPVPPGARLEITLRPEQLAPRMRLIGRDGNPVAPEASSKGWATLAAVEADLMAADEKLLCAYFDEDAEYLPIAGYKHFESTPLVRKLRVGDLVEWARDADAEGPRRSIVRLRGVLRRIRHIGSGEYVDEMRTWCLEDHVFDLVEEGKTAIYGLPGRTGSLRLSPRPWKDF